MASTCSDFFANDDVDPCMYTCLAAAQLPAASSAFISAMSVEMPSWLATLLTGVYVDPARAYGTPVVPVEYTAYTSLPSVCEPWSGQNINWLRHASAVHAPSLPALNWPICIIGHCSASQQLHLQSLLPDGGAYTISAAGGDGLTPAQLMPLVSSSVPMSPLVTPDGRLLVRMLRVVQ